MSQNRRLILRTRRLAPLFILFPPLIAPNTLKHLPPSVDCDKVMIMTKISSTGSFECEHFTVVWEKNEGVEGIINGDEYLCGSHER